MKDFGFEGFEIGDPFDQGDDDLNDDMFNDDIDLLETYSSSLRIMFNSPKEKAEAYLKYGIGAKIKKINWKDFIFVKT